MKIVVTTEKTKSGELHKIEVLDGQKLVHTEVASGVKQRDDIVWKLAELYRVVDIDLKTSKKSKDKKQDFKYSAIPTIPVIDEADAIPYFDDESLLVFNRIVEAIQEGMTMKLDSIRLFELNGTGSYLTAERSNWKNGLQRALDYFVSIESYIKCAEVRDLIKKL
tara:strand:- start:5158 stop:5652 length:495 start_codon:yes stop_codon:yes gene_type:complete